MEDDGSDNARQRKNGEDEMTVVVPPPNSSKLSGDADKDKEGDIEMVDGEEDRSKEDLKETVDPKVKTVAGMFRNKRISRRLANSDRYKSKF